MYNGYPAPHFGYPGHQGPHGPNPNIPHPTTPYATLDPYRSNIGTPYRPPPGVSIPQPPPPQTFGQYRPNANPPKNANAKPGVPKPVPSEDKFQKFRKAQMEKSKR